MRLINNVESIDIENYDLVGHVNLTGGTKGHLFYTTDNDVQKNQIVMGTLSYGEPSISYDLLFLVGDVEENGIRKNKIKLYPYSISSSYLDYFNSILADYKKNMDTILYERSEILENLRPIIL